MPKDALKRALIFGYFKLMNALLGLGLGGSMCENASHCMI